MVFPMGQGGVWWRGLAWPALAAVGLADPLGLGSVVGWRARLLGDVLQFSVGLAARESLGPSPHREQALKAVGAVPVTCWRHLQQAPDHSPGAPLGQQEKERVQAVLGWLRADVLHVSVDAPHDLWHLEKGGTQVRVVLPLECSHFPSCH